MLFYILLLCLKTCLCQVIKIETGINLQFSDETYKNLTKFQITEDVLESDRPFIKISGYNQVNYNRLVLSHLRSVQAVYIIKAGLYIPPRFINLQNLYEVFIKGNSFSTLTKDIFENCHLITFLTLSNNRISAVETKSFSPTIAYLDLKCNELREIKEEWFEKPSIIRTLHLSGNFIEKIQENQFKNFIQLDTLDLSYNRIHQIGSRAFGNHNNFNTLYLSYNNLKKLPEDLFDNDHVSIESLRIDFNNLSYIPLSWNKTVEVLDTPYIDGNPWQCTCYLNYIIKWIPWRSYGTYVPRDRKGEPRCVAVGGIFKDQCVEIVSEHLLETFAGEVSPPPENREKQCECNLDIMTRSSSCW